MNIIEEETLLSPTAAKEEADKVLSLSNSFYERGGNKFSTLGASAYLDSLNDYVEKYSETNPVIDANFSGLVAAARSKLSLLFNVPVVDMPNAGRVGFHVFDDRANGAQADWHLDLAFQNVRWPEPFSSPFSFTVPLSLPDNIGGLDYVDEEGQEQYKPYTVGNIYISSGLFLHRIANPIPFKEGQNRITLQGHGALLSFSNTAVVYF